jgi:hypothetical protein
MQSCSDDHQDMDITQDFDSGIRAATAALQGAYDRYDSPSWLGEVRRITWLSAKMGWTTDRGHSNLRSDFLLR